jgi:hypothetical protein
LNGLIEARRDDGVRGGFDDRMVAGILTLAQDALARDRNRDVVDLKQAVAAASRRERPNDDVVQQLLTAVTAQRQR